MAKLTLTDLTSWTNGQSSIANINNNNAAIETALENTLSRNGLSPNQMLADLDMNSNRILNLPAPISGADPIRLSDVEEIVSEEVASQVTDIVVDDLHVVRYDASQSLEDSEQEQARNNIEAQRENWVDVRDFGASTDLSNNTTSISAAVAFALASNKPVYFDQVYLITGDIPNFHDVVKRGRGGVQVSGSRIWRAEPSALLNTFAARQTVYVDTTLGNDANSGLGAGALAVQTHARVAAILSSYGRLSGNWSVTYAAGEYTGRLILNTITNDLFSGLYIEGPNPGTWDNTTPPASASTTGTGIPTVIFKGSGTGSDWAIYLARIGGQVNYIKFVDWGGVSLAENSGGVQAQYQSQIRLTNCHFWNCSYAHMFRDFTHHSMRGGLISNCRTGGFFVSSARFDYGANLPAGATDAPLIRLCTFGIDVWEDADGHADNAIYEDNNTHVYARKGGVAKCGLATMRNTGANGASVGIRAEDNAVISTFGGVTWSGTHTPRILMRGGAVDDLTAASRYDERLVTFDYTDRATSGTATLTGLSTTVPGGFFTQAPMALRFKGVLTCNNTVSTASVGIRNNGAFVASLTIPISTALTTVVEIEMYALTATTQRVVLRATKSNAIFTATTVGISVADTTVDCNSDFVAQLYASCANAADTVTFKTTEIWQRAG